MMRVLACLLATLLISVSGETIVIGGDSPGWTEGVCYVPLAKALSGDVLEFVFAGHNVYRLASKSHFDRCDFTGALLLAEVGESPFQYEITREDQDEGDVYFACAVGDHCMGGTQKVQVSIDQDFGQDLSSGREVPESSVVFGITGDACAAIQEGAADEFQGTGSLSTCTEPELQDDGRYYVSCLSPPATLTPGGVINNLFILHYPYPTDQRVAVGLRMWEFVQPSPDGEGYLPVPVNQLYVHHLSGRVVLGQGAEGIRRSKPDSPYPPPNAVLTGDEGDAMVFHIIDLREVDDWLPCIECRCVDGNGTYLEIGGSDSLTGGVSCCHNCTDLTSPTIDYRMRYNVSWSYITEPVNEIIMLTADISPVVGKVIEFDVPRFDLLPEDQIAPEDPTVQRLERTLPFNEMFKMDFFAGDYSGPEIVKLFRCVGHLHVAAIGMWLEDAFTGERLCDGQGFYGKDPAKDKGFLTAIAVDDYNIPKVFRADKLVRLVTEYNATEVHTGVMGMMFIFISGERMVAAEDAALTVPVCSNPTCDIELLPQLTMDNLNGDCEDKLSDHPACKFGGLCDCDDVINAAESTGCNGVYTTEMGDLEVNSVCAKSCGCPSTSCEDTLSDSPACSFGGLCDCEGFVNAEESTGCGGVYTTDMGEFPINDYCPKYCDACPNSTKEELFEEAFVEQLTEELAEACRFATKECRAMIANSYSCGIERSGVEQLDPVARQAMVTHGVRLALKYSKLGDLSLHRGVQDDLVIVECSELEQGSTSSSWAFSGALAVVVGLALTVFMW